MPNNTAEALVPSKPLDIATRDTASTAIARSRKSTLSVDELAGRVEHYPEPIRTETRFAQAFFVQSCNSSVEVLRSLAAERLKFRRSTPYFSNWLHGVYFRGGTGDVKVQGRTDWLNFCQLLREHDRMTNAIGKMGIVITPTVRAIEAYVKERMAARFSDKVGIVVGMTGSQKGASLKFIAAALGFPRAVYMECPARDSLVGFQRKLARRYNVKAKNSAAAREQELSDALHEDRVLIIGNIQRAVVEGKKQSPVWEWLLEIQEENKFTLIADVKLDHTAALELMREETGGYFEQLVGRAGGVHDLLVLPDFTPAADLRAIAAAFKLPADKRSIEYLTKWSRQPGRIRSVFKRLERVQDFVSDDGRTTITIDDLVAVDAYVPPTAIEEDLS